MNRVLFISLLLLTILLTTLKAQTSDFGIWTTIGAEKKVNKWDFNANAEWRTKDNVKQTDRWSLQIETGYNLFKKIKTGLSYQFIYFYDSKYADFQPRNRFTFFLQGKQKWNRFSFALNQKFQVTTKDESDRIKLSGKTDTYKVNPEWTWRNRLKISYNIPRLPLTPSFAFESFYQLNNPDGNSFDKLRYTLSLSYQLSKHNGVEVYGLTDREINITNPNTMYITGVSYVYSF